MISKMITIQRNKLNPDFLVEIAKRCSCFDCTITMYAKDQTVNLKSIVNIFGTSLNHDETVELVFDGKDEADAADAMTQLFI